MGLAISYVIVRYGTAMGLVEAGFSPVSSDAINMGNTSAKHLRS
jgi:hypothetical protein